MNKYLGVDFGLKNIGLAISDDSGKVAFPLVVLKNSKNLINQISEICNEKNIKTLVLGESKDFSGAENPIMESIKAFRDDFLKVSNISVVFYPEFLTSVEAKRFTGENDMHDASAAALILQSYLDKINSKN